jgi:hypothetical protein
MLTDEYITCMKQFKLDGKILFEPNKKYKIYENRLKHYMFIFYNEHAIRSDERVYTFYYEKRDAYYGNILSEYFNLQQLMRKEKLKKINWSK